MSAVQTMTSVPTTQQFKKLADCNNLQQAFETSEFKNRIAESLPRHISADRMIRVMVQAANKSPDIYKCDFRQAIGSFLTLSQLGLEPNTPLQHAFLIPFKTKMWNPQTKKRDQEGYDLNVVIGYPGLADLAFRSGLVKNIHADVVWPGDEFTFEYGTNAGLRHVPMGRQSETDVPIWAYAHAGLKDGQAFEVMPWSAVMRVRDLSQGYKSAVYAKANAEEKGWKTPAGFTEAPWVKHVIEMAKKTPWRRLAKWIPKSPELAGALALEDMTDRGVRPDYGAIFDGTATAIDGLSEALEHEQPMDTGAAFSVRQPEPAVTAYQAPPPPAATQAPAAAPKPAAAKPAAKAKPPAAPPAAAPPAPQDDEQGGGWESGPPWEQDGQDEPAIPAMPISAEVKIAPKTVKPIVWYSLATEDGELVTNSTTSDPVKWATDFLGMVKEAEDAGQPPDEIIAANFETISDVKAISPEAAALLADLDQTSGGELAAEVTDLRVIVPLTAKGAPDLGGYVAAVRDALDGITTADDLQAWTAENVGIYKSMPSFTQTAIGNKISELTLRLNPPETRPEIAAEPEPVEMPAEIPDSDARWVRGMCDDMNQTSDSRSLAACIGGIAVSTKVKRLKIERPELYRMIGDVHRAKTAEFAAKA